MFTTLDVAPSSLDEHERGFVEQVRKHGWFNTQVGADTDEPNFSYSTGMWFSAGHPELIIFAIKDEFAHDIFWDVFREAKAGRPLPIDRRTDVVFANNPAYAFPVAMKHYPSFLGWSRWFYCGDEFPCLQIVWPDRAGVFPWERGFAAEFHDNQPDLTESGWVSEIVR